MATARAQLIFLISRSLIVLFFRKASDSQTHGKMEMEVVVGTYEELLLGYRVLKVGEVDK